jgi:ubiquinone/menaquinone biosynthesis C-methylase UbiE
MRQVLETCAGSNRNLKYYKPRTALTLIDFSPSMVSMGSAKVSPFVQYNYVQGNVMEMPFQEGQFDCVLDTFGLEYVLNPHKALEEMRR